MSHKRASIDPVLNREIQRLTAEVAEGSTEVVEDNISASVQNSEFAIRNS